MGGGQVAGGGRSIQPYASWTWKKRNAAVARLPAHQQMNPFPASLPFIVGPRSFIRKQGRPAKEPVELLRPILSGPKLTTSSKISMTPRNIYGLTLPMTKRRLEAATSVAGWGQLSSPNALLPKPRRSRP